MALVALSKKDNEKYVSDLDPAKQWVDEPINPQDKSKDAPTHRVEKIDWSEATVFVLGSLDNRILASIYDGSLSMSMEASGGGDESRNVDMQMTLNASNYQAVRFGLVDWTNFIDDKGKVISFKKEMIKRDGQTYQVVARECMNCLDVRLISELADKIKARSSVTPALAKNSDAA